MDIRVSINSEVPAMNIPSGVNTDFVRIKQHKRFHIVRDTDTQAWAFDFAMIWSGKTKTEAEISQNSEEPIFVIECELIDNKNYL